MIKLLNFAVDVSRTVTEAQTSGQEHSQAPQTEPSSVKEIGSKVSHEVDQAKLILESLREMVREMAEKTTPGQLFRWTDYKSSQKYHPNFMTRSLDDTPQMYSEDRLAKRELRTEVSCHLKRNASAKPKKASKSDQDFRASTKSAWKESDEASTTGGKVSQKCRKQASRARNLAFESF